MDQMGSIVKGGDSDNIEVCTPSGDINDWLLLTYTKYKTHTSGGDRLCFHV